MKIRILSILLILFFVASNSFAYDFEVDGLCYNILSEQENSVRLAKVYRGGSIDVPSTVIHNGINYYVTSIGAYAFQNCTSLKEITIPNSVTSIGDDAFNGCISLQRITIPNSVTSIGLSAFYKCTSLQEVNIPNSVTYIAYSTFEDCTTLQEVNIPNSVTRIKGRAFKGCSSLQKVIIGECVTNIGEEAFEKCNNIDTLEYLAPTVFDVFPDSKTVILGNKTTSIDYGAFMGHYSLQKIIIPNSVVSIGGRAFENCSSLRDIEGLEGVKEIKWRTFYGCESLHKIIIPQSVESIAGDAFENCRNIETVEYLAPTVFGVFSDLNRLKTVILGDKTITIDTYAFSECDSLREITIPNSVTSIGGSAFYNCKSLTSLTIPSSVTSISYSAFYGCTGLTSLTIPSSVTSIGGGAFQGCTGLTSFTIPGSVTAIEDFTFYECTSLEKVTIPNSVESIGKYTFGECKSLKNVVMPNVSSLGESAFKECSSLDSITILGQINSIESKTFSYCDNLKYVFISDSVRSIDEYAFWGCDKIRELHLPCMMQEIQKNAISLSDSCDIYYNGKCSLDNISGRGYGNINLITEKSNLINLYKNNYEFCNIYSIENGETYVPVIIDGYDNDCMINGIADSVSIMKLDNREVNISILGGKDIFYIDGKDYSEYARNGLEFTYSIIPNLSHKYNHIFVCGINRNDDNALDLNVSSSGNLINQVDLSKINDIEYLKISGELNGTDILVIRKMGKIRVLDMSDVKIVNGGNSYYEQYSCSENTFSEYILNSKNTLEVVLLPKTIKSIKPYAFLQCSKLSSIIIPKNVEYVSWNAFKQCSQLHNVTVESDKEPITIFNDVYDSMENLPICNVNLYRNIISYFPDNAGGKYLLPFANNKNIKNVILAGDFTIISNRIFDGCENLENVEISENVTEIGYAVFKGTSIHKFEIPDGVKSIGNGAFSSCSYLQEVNIPNSVTSIGSGAFGSCPSLQEIIIPNSVTSIGEGAFCRCSSLQEIIIPNGVTSIADETFEFCESLTKIVIPNSVTSIGHWAFANCTSLQEITIPNSVTGIGECTFYNCSQLSKVNSLNPTPPEIYDETFKGVDYNTCQLNVPQGAKTLYWLHPYWEKFLNMNELTDEEMEALPVESVTADNIGDYISIRNGTMNILDSKAHVIVYSSNGQKIYDSTNSSSSITLPSNIYIVKVNDKLVKIKL